MTDQKVHTEQFELQGEQIVAKIKDLVRQGNIRRVTIKNEDGKTIVDFPLTIGVVGALLMPQLAALGAIAALITNCTLVVERADDEPESTADTDEMAGDGV